MPRARNLKPCFFKDEDLVDCGAPAMLLFAGLWTLADREGRLEDRPKLIKAEIFPYTTVSVEALLKVLADKTFIIRYEVNGKKYIQIRSWHKHQKPHIKESPSTYPAPDQHLLSTGNSGAEPGNSGTRTPSTLQPSTFNPETRIDPESESELDHAEQFESRWSRWPSKGRTRRPLCEQRWCDLFQKLTAGDSMGLLADIDAGIQRWLNSEQFRKGFVFGFSDFLSQRRWGEHPDQVAEAQAADEQYSNQEVEDHWQEMQRLMRAGVKTHEADQQARQMIAERRRHAAAS